MPRPVDEMIGELRNRWDSASRDASTLTRAHDLAGRLPLVHRTGQPGQPWKSIFQDARLEGRTSGTRWEREALGVEKTTYFFWGCGAYPKGTVAMLLDGVLPDPRCTATPFDTGGCEAGFFVRDGRALTEAESRSTIDRFTLDDGARVSEYGLTTLPTSSTTRSTTFAWPGTAGHNAHPSTSSPRPPTIVGHGPSRCESTGTCQCPPSG